MNAVGTSRVVSFELPDHSESRHDDSEPGAELSLSFSGCGFLLIYHAGAWAAIKEYAPQLTRQNVYGASGGAIIAAGVICNVCISDVINLILQAVTGAQKGTMMTLSPSYDLSKIIFDGLNKMLPQNAHELCSGRLFISMTRWCDLENVVVSDFESRDELIQAIVCSSFIPVICGVRRPKFRNVEYVDGGFSNNQPSPADNVLTLSPFAGEHDICPSDRDSASMLGIDFTGTNILCTTSNLFRVATCLFPPSLDICSKICRQGFQDALVELTRRKMAPCVRCLTIQSNRLALPALQRQRSFSRMRSMSVTSNASRHRLQSECEVCCESEFDHDDVTALFPSVIQTAIDEAKKTESKIFQYLNGFRLYRWTRLVMTPALIPLDFVSYSFQVLQSWLYPESTIYYFTQRLRQTIDLANMILNRQNQSKAKQPPSCHLNVADIEHHYSRHATGSKTLEDSCTVVEQADGEIRDEGSMNALIQYSQEHDAILAYYYMDEGNQMYVCKIFDVHRDHEQDCQSRAFNKHDELPTTADDSGLSDIEETLV